MSRLAAVRRALSRVHRPVVGGLLAGIVVGAGRAPAEPPRTLQCADPAAQVDARDREGRLLEDVAAQQRLINEAIRVDVENALRVARGRMASDPAAVGQDLKLILERVAAAPELKNELRAQLRQQLETTLREAARSAAAKEAIDLERQQVRAAAADQRRVADELARRQERIRQLMDRFNALLDEGRLAAADQVAQEAEQAAPELPATASAALVNRAKEALATNLTNRAARQKGVIATLGSVESALVPFDDEQPIVYDLDIWEQMSSARKSNAVTDLKKVPPAEAKIRQQLLEPTSIELNETPLEQMIDYLKDLHGIEIQLDTKTLSEIGLSGDAPLTGTIKGTSLRSALRFLLGKLDLTYVIKDEMLLITTVDRASQEVITRAYSVAELVVPIRSGGLGMPGGASNNMQGFNSPASSVPGNNFNLGPPGAGPGQRPGPPF